ncbi:hypothetical protein AX16_004403 [Volvariella volvacea WC 439]|nr:hypothetical protein AX16_004403 [Volvariella volvacea WC 439]
MFASLLILALVAISSTLAHPIHQEAREVRIIGRTQSAKRAVNAPELQLLADGNKKFRETVEADDPGLLSRLTAEGQAPPFMFLGCADSRVSEGTIFHAKPGTLFTQRNIANQFIHTDANAHSVLSYAVSVLGVKHVIVMGHYGCGGVAAAIATPAASPVEAALGEVENWIAPIRELFQSSSRPEIVELRERIRGLPFVEEPEVNEPGFRALVEENVKQTVHRIATTSVLANHFHALSLNSTGTGTSAPVKRAEGGPIGDVFVHGFVYDIENGEIRNLNISVGPPDVDIPEIPFAAVADAGSQLTLQHNAAAAPSAASHAPPAVDAHQAPEGAVHASPRVRCEQLCKARRALLGAFNW